MGQSMAPASCIAESAILEREATGPVKVDVPEKGDAREFPIELCTYVSVNPRYSLSVT